ncbi:MAG: chemotaxis protein CheW [Verrucomicrobiota bacterium]
MSPAQAAEANESLVVFRLDDQRYAIGLTAVERVLRMVEISPFPKAPEIVSGAIDLHGELLPVLNIRRRFRLLERAPTVRDLLVIARTRRRRVALIVDEVEGVFETPASERVAADTVAPGLEYLRGVTRLEPHGLVFIHDLETFLSLDEEKALEAAEAR